MEKSVGLRYISKFSPQDLLMIGCQSEGKDGNKRTPSFLPLGRRRWCHFVRRGRGGGEQVWGIHHGLHFAYVTLEVPMTHLFKFIYSGNIKYLH